MRDKFGAFSYQAKEHEGYGRRDDRGRGEVEAQEGKDAEEEARGLQEVEAPRGRRGRRRGQQPGEDDEARDGGGDVERREPSDDRVSVAAARGR